MSTPRAYTEFFAYVGLDEQGNEHLCGARTPAGLGLLVATSRDDAEEMRPIAEGIARQSGRPVQLVRFTTRQSLEVIGGSRQ